MFTRKRVLPPRHNAWRSVWRHSAGPQCACVAMPAAVCARLGRIPTVDEYYYITTERINPLYAEIYSYLNFDQIEGFANGESLPSADRRAKEIAGT